MVPAFHVSRSARIKLAANANDTAVVGVVDQIMYVPNEATRKAYEAQQQAEHEAATRSQNGIESNHEPMANIQNRISDEAGTLHADSYATNARPEGYCSVVTLGA
jgi:vacuolar-type H+-ATPase subunit H